MKLKYKLFGQRKKLLSLSNLGGYPFYHFDIQGEVSDTIDKTESALRLVNPKLKKMKNLNKPHENIYL